MSTGDAHQSTPTQLTGLALMLSHSLRYTGYETTHRQAFASTTRLETEMIQIADLISIAPAPTPTLMPIMLSNAPAKPIFWFYYMYETDTLRKTYPSCVWRLGAQQHCSIGCSCCHCQVDIWSKQTVTRNGIIDSTNRI